MYISKHQGTPALLEGTKSPSKDTGLAEPSYKPTSNNTRAIFTTTGHSGISLSAF